MRFDLEGMVGHGRHRASFGVDLVGDGIVHVGAHQFVDGAVQGCREEQLLPLPHGVENGSDSLHEAQVGHVIGLVEDGHLHPGQIGVTGLQQVDEAPRGGHDDVHALLERLGLRAIAHAASDEDRRQVHGRGQRRDDVGDLHGELAGGREDEGTRSTVRTLLGGQPGEHRNAEGQRLARTGGGAPQHVLAADGIGDGSDLDAERLVDAGGRQGCDDGVGHTEGGESPLVVHRRGVELTKIGGLPLHGVGVGAIGMPVVPVTPT